MKKRYGGSKTHLTLTDKAEAFYSGTTPFDIYEIEHDDGSYSYTYRFGKGDRETKPMTEAELIEALEEMADEEVE